MITILIMLTSYYFVVYADKKMISYFKWLNLVYFVVLLLLSLIAFLNYGQITASTKQKKWNILSDFEKYNYKNSIEQLVSINQANVGFYGIYAIILAFLFLLMGAILYCFDNTLPLNWVRTPKSRTSFFKGNAGIEIISDIF